ncbi:MAG: DUF4147 domain-containing protein [Desulfobacteraceae bacterium]
MPEKEIFDIFNASVSAVLPENAIKNSLSVNADILSIDGTRYDLNPYKNGCLFGVGKASIDMAKQTEKIVGPFVKHGFVVGTKESDLKNVDSFLSDHPVPSKRSVEAGRELKKRMQSLSREEFFIFLLSGGASSLVEIPKTGVTLSDIQNTTKTLLASGADITQVNMIRKSLSDLKGGELAGGIKANGVVVVISDVVTGEIEAIGSAPMFDGNLPTKRDINTIIDQYGLNDRVSKKVLEVIQQYEPRESKRAFPHHIIVDNQTALDAGRKEAARLGYKTIAAPFQLGGEAADMAEKVAAYAVDLQKNSANEKICVLMGGETTVTLKGRGTGGRNQEFVLAMMKALKGKKGIAYFCGGTDGIDGNSRYAGAFGSWKTYERSVQKNLDLNFHLKNNDSTPFFEKAGGVLETGYTGTNVADVGILIIDPTC